MMCSSTAPAITDLAADGLESHCRAALAAGARMQFMYALFPSRDAPAQLRYVLHPGPGAPPQIWRCAPEAQPVASLAAMAPLLSWYEREATDLFGISFRGQPMPQPLVLLPGTLAERPPMTPGATTPLRHVAAPHPLPDLAGAARADVQIMPFGPVRADVLESAQLVFYYIGEAILHFHPQLFFKHRGMEKRFEGLAPRIGTVLAERVSGVGSVAHALAYCHAIEAAAGCDVPRRAAWLRVLLAELERLYNHLQYLGHLCHTTTLKVGEAQGKYLEELAKQLNCRVSGSRLLRGLIVPGGLSREPAVTVVGPELDRLEREFLRYSDLLASTNSHVDRLMTTGVLGRRLAFDQGATGPVERASGIDRDSRRDQPYGAYAELPLRVAVREGGDAYARQSVRLDEILNSITLLRAVWAGLPAGPIRAPCAAVPCSEGLGWAETPRGTAYYAVHLDAAGRLGRVKIKSPSFSNWRVFPYTVHDSNMMDYAINEASFGLTVSGCDR